MLAALTLLPGSALAQTDSLRFTNTLRVWPTDSHEAIIDKATHIVPTANQLAALRNEFIAFVHFGPNTFSRREWGTGFEDPKDFALQTLDTDQWCAAMRDAGMKMVIITAKHHDGFVLWQSRYTKHGIMSSPFQNGQGDVVKSLAASCRKYGLKLGIYLSPADLYQIENPDGLYGNLSKRTLRTIPRSVEGRPFANKTTFQFVVDDYNEYFLNQLFELLTEYGPISEVWFDGAHPKRKGGQTYDYHAWKKLIHTLAPQAVIFGREDVRWCGNEAGATRSTEWNVIPYQADPDTLSQFYDMTDTDLGSREQLYKGRYLHYQEAETNTSIRDGWFYRNDDEQAVRSADDVFDIYERAVGGNSTFLLNIPPNRQGRFGDRDVAVLHEAGQRIRDTYGTNLLAGAQGPAAVLDDADSTSVDATEPIVVNLSRPTAINRFVVQEPVQYSGERIEACALDAWVDGDWREVAAATNVGYKRILRFADVTTDRLRLRVTASRATPYVSHITAHHYAARPPQLTCTRSVDGLVTITPRLPEFGWKSHGQNPAANLNAGYTIHYTTDGTEPTASSPCYTAPFSMGRGELKAVAVLGNQTGALMHERLGLVKKDWRIVSPATGAEGHAVAAAIDADGATYWQSTDAAKPASLTLDLGSRQQLTTFAYTPPRGVPDGLLAKGRIMVSNDGKKWRLADTFEFGNLVNDPSRRTHRLAKSATARYVRIEPVETTGNGRTVVIAEIDWL